MTCFSELIRAIRQSFTPIIWGGLLLLFMGAKQTGCSRKIPGDTIVPATSVRSSDFLFKQLEQRKPPEIESLAARAKIYAEGDGMAVEASANLIWIRDSVLWMNVKKLGIEAARVLVTRDSVFILNRLDKTFEARAMASLQREYSLPEGFPFLQYFLLASAWLPADMAFQADIKDDLHRLSGSNHMLAADYRLEEGSFVLRRETFVQQRDSRILSLQFGGFEKLSGAGIFPYIRRIEAFSPETGALNLDLVLTDIETNVPKSYRFDIPAHYQRME